MACPRRRCTWLCAWHDFRLGLDDAGDGALLLGGHDGRAARRAGGLAARSRRRRGALPMHAVRARLARVYGYASLVMAAPALFTGDCRSSRRRRCLEMALGACRDPDAPAAVGDALRDDRRRRSIRRPRQAARGWRGRRARRRSTSSYRSIVRAATEIPDSGERAAATQRINLKFARQPQEPLGVSPCLRCAHTARAAAPPTLRRRTALAHAEAESVDMRDTRRRSRRPRACSSPPAISCGGDVQRHRQSRERDQQRPQQDFTASTVSRAGGRTARPLHRARASSGNASTRRSKRRSIDLRRR